MPNFEFYFDRQNLKTMKGQECKDVLAAMATKLCEVHAKDCYLKKGGKALAPLFECHNGSTVPQFYAFGHAHIDVAWLWPLAETGRKIHRTFAAHVAHMDRYPNYKFLQSQPYLYRRTKELYPDLYEKIKEKVASGQWIPEGGLWVEADTNISSGEALIRQFVHGKRFFKEEFGVENRFLWLPDVFGYTAALPQIMKGCGIDGFSTQKIWWTYNGGEKFSYNDFYWKGLKGFMIPFGYGDGSGGPSREFIENLERLEDFEGCPKVEMASPGKYFDNTPVPEVTYVSELYFQCHRGVQTSQAKVKWGNRKSELALRETEFLGTLAKLAGGSYPLKKVDENWKQVLLCQFHDILPGSSIKRVYDEAYELHTGVLKEQEEIQKDLKAVLCKKEDATTVFNSLSFARKVLIELPEGWKGALADGKEVTVQEIEDSLIAQVTVPACGTVSLMPLTEEKESRGSADDDAVIEMLYEGELEAALRISRKISNSVLVQTVTLKADSERVDFDTVVDWQETHRMLKVGFDVDVHAAEAAHEIQFGYVKRPNHRSRPYDFDRFEVPNHRWTALCEENRGAAVLNDSKYGVNVLGTSINLTLLRSPFSPDPECDHGMQHFVYSFMPFKGSLSESGVVNEAYDLNCPVSLGEGSCDTFSALSVDASNVFVDTLKPAEDGSDDYVIRLYEAMGNRTAAKLTLNIPAVQIAECNMLEEEGIELAFTKAENSAEITLSFRPFEIKTLRIKAGN